MPGAGWTAGGIDPYYQRVLTAGIQNVHHRAMVHWNLGDSYQALGRLEEAIDAYRDGIEAQPAHAVIRLALGVAYDRDGQVALAVDSIQESLGINPAASMTGPDGRRALFVPREDEDYYRGLAHKVARRRSLAIVYFRSYLSRAAASPWSSRAQHLAQLGSPVLGESDVNVRGVAPERRGPFQRPVAQALPDLQKCIEGQPFARILLGIGLPSPTGASAAGKPGQKDKKDKDKTSAGSLSRPAPQAQVNPGVTVHDDGPAQTVDQTLLDCVRKRAERIKLPRSREGSVVVSVGVIAR